MKNKSYPSYATYGEHRQPSILSQVYPRPTFAAEDNYYPKNEIIDAHFRSTQERTAFGAATFCGFLEDTIEVEHCLVIPAVASLRRLPWQIPPQAEQDLFKTATDEGFHAEQSLQFLEDLRSHFRLAKSDEFRKPLFLIRLEASRAAEPNPVHRDLITVLNGVVTETRISIELSRFATDTYLAQSVRDVCRSHAEDESIHASQFKALGEWLWSEFDDDTRHAAARFITASTIARSLPDVRRMAYYFHQATGRSHEESKRLVYSLYTEDILIDEMLVAARPTVGFLKRLGVEEHLPFSEAVENERRQLGIELETYRAQVRT